MLDSPMVRVFDLGHRDAPLYEEKSDGSVSKANRIEEGAKDSMWNPLLARTHRPARSGRPIPTADQARPKSRRVVAV